MIRLNSFLWLWFQCVCPLATPTILLGFLLPWMWGISSRLLQQSAADAPYLGWGVYPHCHPSWPWTWSSSSRPSWACAATAPWTVKWLTKPRAKSTAWTAVFFLFPLLWFEFLKCFFNFLSWCLINSNPFLKFKYLTLFQKTVVATKAFKSIPVFKNNSNCR